MSGRKNITQTDHYGPAGHVLDSLSKSALADLVVDLIRRGEQDEHLDGVNLADAVIEAFRPIATAREDRVPLRPRQYVVTRPTGERRFGWTMRPDLPLLAHLGTVAWTPEDEPQPDDAR